MKRFGLGLVALAFLASACGTSSPPAGQAQAQAACQSSGPTALADAQKAASQNSKFDGLATDERASAAHQGQITQALSDGDSSDDGGLNSLANSESFGSTSSTKVLADCIGLGLSVLHR